MATTPLQFSFFPSSPLLHLPSRKPLCTPLYAGRSKKNKQAGGSIERPGELRREAKGKGRMRGRENKFYRRKKQASNYADSFNEDELNMIGMGYDRFVRFMSGPDDPNLRHPHDWYKYGEFGPYSWRGIVVGPPIRGRFSDDRVTLIEQVSSHEEWDEIDQFDMANHYSQRLAKLNHEIGLKHFWVFVRHPKWRPSEMPWQQWTLVAELAVESGKDERIDKWTLMNRLGNRAREMITKCAAWQRPDVIYVKKPIYQVRFEPQIDFFRPLGPLLDPETESDFQFFTNDENAPPCSYFQGLCKIVKANPKSYVDDVVKAYVKLSEEDKSDCLEYLLGNHPYELLHPFTKEWKVKLEELEFGCDAPDEDEEEEEEELSWSEDEDEERESEEREEEEDEEEEGEEEKEEYWEQKFEKALTNSEAMEKLVETSVKASNELYKRQIEEERKAKEEQERAEREGEEMEEERQREREEREKKREKERVDGSFLKAAVRPFTYRNLVKEIVLMRHAIVDGDISFENTN